MVARAPQSVIGYHGCSRDTADAVLRGAPFAPSANAMDWLGQGIYFWEYGPFRALEWAQEHHAEPAVLEARIELGECLNLLDREHFARVVEVYADEVTRLSRIGVRVPENTARGAHFLDRIVIDECCRTAAEVATSFQTGRGCFPEGLPIYAGSKILSKAHVQLAVRDRSCIKELRRVTLESGLSAWERMPDG